MCSYRSVVECDSETGVLIGYVPGWPGAHTQGSDMDELQQNLREVIEILLEDGQPVLELGVRRRADSPGCVTLGTLQQEVWERWARPCRSFS